ncbi:hypothetical protein C8R43DRAFT_1140613 [Mycena crocata]|nr:hypothetical protein C8R43DRAFT_1140613 [Mycena crocata]
MPVSADKNRPRKKRTSTWVRVVKKDRRNLKLWAEEVRKSILRPHLAAYTDALEWGWRAERDYLLEVCREFHAKILWRLEDHEEPVLPLAEYDPFASVIVEDLGDEELVLYPCTLTFRPYQKLRPSERPVFRKLSVRLRTDSADRVFTQ